MATLGSIEEVGTQNDSGHLLPPVVGDDEESQEMISPELVFPEKFAKAESNGRGASHPRVSRVLVLDAERPIKYPLYKNVMTIGRADMRTSRSTTAS